MVTVVTVMIILHLHHNLGQQNLQATAVRCIWRRKSILKINVPGFPGGAVVKNLPANAGDTGSSPGPGRSHMPQSN